MKITSKEKLREMVAEFVEEEKADAKASLLVGFFLSSPFFCGFLAITFGEPKFSNAEALYLTLRLVLLFFGILLFGSITLKSLLDYYLPTRKKAREGTYVYQWLDVEGYSAEEDGIVCEYTYNGTQYVVPLGESEINENVTLKRKVHVFDFGSAEKPIVYAELDKED